LPSGPFTVLTATFILAALVLLLSIDDSPSRET